MINVIVTLMSNYVTVINSYGPAAAQSNNGCIMTVFGVLMVIIRVCVPELAVSCPPGHCDKSGPVLLALGHPQVAKLDQSAEPPDLHEVGAAVGAGEGTGVGVAFGLGVGLAVGAGVGVGEDDVGAVVKRLDAGMTCWVIPGPEQSNETFALPVFS